MVGRKIYLLSDTQLHMTYAVSMISQFMHNSKESHLQTAHRLLWYLKGPLVLKK